MGGGNVGHFLDQLPYAYPGANYLQGAKAAQARARKAEKASKSAGSQLKTNEKAKSIICKVCRQPFVSFFLHFPPQR